MKKESEFEKEVVKYLKSKGCDVFKMRIAPGVAEGTPDRLFLKEGFWGFLEVKASKDAPFRPLQKEKIKKYNDWSYARAVYPENWEEVKAELEKIL